MPPSPPPTLTRRPLKCDGPPPQWVSSALETAKQVKVLTLAIPVQLVEREPTTTTAVTAAATTPNSPRLRLLLGRKKRGFGEGYFNGFGGKLEPGESTDEAARRELLEESGLTPGALEHVGVLTFVFDDQAERPWQVHVYAVPSWSGEPEETDEMAPEWFDAAPGALPFARMWADDRFWYPRFVEAQAERRLRLRVREEEQQKQKEQPPKANCDEGGGGGGGPATKATTTSFPCFEGVFGFRSTHEMAWAGLWALERPGEGARSAVADEAGGATGAAETGEEGKDDAGRGPRDGGAAAAAAAADLSSSSCPWLPLAPAGGEALEPESLAHLRRAAELARATAAVGGGKPTAWKGWAGGEREMGGNDAGFVVAAAAV